MNYFPSRNSLKHFVIILLFIQIMKAQDLSDQYNPSFEVDDVGYRGVPTKWMFPASPTVSSEIIAESPEIVAGKKCLLVDYSKAVPGDMTRTFLSKLIEIKPDKRYTYRFWLKTESQSNEGYGMSVGIVYFDKSKAELAPVVYDKRYQVMHAGIGDQRDWRDHD